MVRQYIGARYVPKFYENSDGTAAWRAGVIYEPLTIVTYNGNSYTSKKAVPAEIGNPSANTEYWVATGVYNEQVETIRQELETLTQRVDDIPDLDPRMIGRKIVIITDSYGMASATGGGVWTTTFKTRLGLTEGTDVFTYARGGAGFDNGEFLNLLQNYTAELSGVTDVLVAGGCNDFGHDPANVIEAIAAFKTACETKYPGSILSIASIGHTLQPQYRDSAIAQVESYHKSAGRGIRILEGTENILHKTSLFYDDVHPNTAGSAEIGTYLASAFITGSCIVRRYEPVTITASGNNTIGSSAMFQSQNGDVCSFSALNRAVAWGGGITVNNGDTAIPYNTDIEIGTFSSNSIIYGNSEAQCSIPVFGLCYHTGNNHTFTGLLKIFANKLYLGITSVDGAMAPLPAVATFTIAGIHATFASMLC